MKKRNLITQAAIASAFLAMAGGAQAGTLSGASVFATELFGSTATSALALTPAAVTYTFNTPGGIVINPTGNIYEYFRLSAGLLAAAPATSDFSFGGGLSGLAASAVALSTDSTTVRVTLNNTSSTTNVTIGVGGTVVWTPAAGAITNVNTALATAASTLDMQASVASSGSTLPNTGTALPADLDNGLSNNFAFVTSTPAITSKIAASSSFATVETQKIDLTATSPGSRFTAPGNTLSNANSTTVVNLGSLTFTDATGTQGINTNAATDYTIAGRGTAATLNGTVTGSFKTGATMALTTDTACTTGIAAGSSGTLNTTTLATFTFSGGTLPTSATANYICLTVPATTGAIPVTTPTASFTFTKTTTTDAANTASGTLYALGNNGSTVDVRSYIPAVTSGYTSYVRVINTGAVAATVTGQWLYEDGTTSTPATLITPALAVGGSTTLSSAQIEAALGAPTASIGNDRPRLRLTASTNGLQAQSFFLTNANGNFSDATGAQ